MPIYDLICLNGHKQYDCLLKLGERPPCPECAAATDTLWERSGNVIGDDIPGGIWMEHGLCNSDGSPRKYYSKSEIAREAKRRGLVNKVEHVTTQGSDKAPHTKRWV
jgi:hypothetical protein